ncbi:MAG: glutathione S-transferase N-terminal domain-containing protein [Selenomonadaceae bacterium]|nr:glutathione S-transferase N-terminal domain-containing protein [Selenomonadaceae bacterium]
MVKVYTVTGCPYCEKVKRYLQSKGVEFTAYDIEQDAAARDACKKLTSMDYAVPVTTIDNVNFVMDYDKDELDKLLCL